MKDFIDELLYMCKHNDPKVKTTYIMITAILILLPIVFLSGVIAEIVFIGAHNFQVLPVVLSVLSLIVEIVLIIWLKKS